MFSSAQAKPVKKNMVKEHLPYIGRDLLNGGHTTMLSARSKLWKLGCLGREAIQISVMSQCGKTRPYAREKRTIARNIQRGPEMIAILNGPTYEDLDQQRAQRCEEQARVAAWGLPWFNGDEHGRSPDTCCKTNSI